MKRSLLVLSLVQTPEISNEKISQTMLMTTMIVIMTIMTTMMMVMMTTMMMEAQSVQDDSGAG